MCVFTLHFIFAFSCVIIAHHLSEMSVQTIVIEYKTMALGLPDTFTRIFIFITNSKKTAEKRLCEEIFSTSDVCATKTYGLISSYLNEKK